MSLGLSNQSRTIQISSRIMEKMQENHQQHIKGKVQRSDLGISLSKWGRLKQPSEKNSIPQLFSDDENVQFMKDTLDIEKMYDKQKLETEFQEQATTYQAQQDLCSSLSKVKLYEPFQPHLDDVEMQNIGTQSPQKPIKPPRHLMNDQVAKERNKRYIALIQQQESGQKILPIHNKLVRLQADQQHLHETIRDQENKLSNLKRKPNQFGKEQNEFEARMREMKNNYKALQARVKAILEYEYQNTYLRAMLEKFQQLQEGGSNLGADLLQQETEYLVEYQKRMDIEIAEQQKINQTRLAEVAQNRHRLAELKTQIMLTELEIKRLEEVAEFVRTRYSGRYCDDIKPLVVGLRLERTLDLGSLLSPKERQTLLKTQVLQLNQILMLCQQRQQNVYVHQGPVRAFIQNLGATSKSQFLQLVLERQEDVLRLLERK